MEKNESSRRPGTLTAGLALIAFGVLFLLHLWFDAVSYARIFSLWPTILISLGLELLCFSRRETVRYDFGSMALLLLLAVFAMGMAVADELLRRVPELWEIF